MANIEVKGLAELQRKLGTVNAATLMRRPMSASLSMVEAKLKDEPTPRPGQRYIRGRGPTNARGQVIRNTSESMSSRWNQDIVTTPRGVTGTLRNDASYAPWVVSNNFQAWMHKGRWTTDLQAVNALLPRIYDKFEEEVERLLR